MMLTGGKWGEAHCLNCGFSLGARITCPHCGYINSVEPVDAKAIGLAIHYPDCWDTAAYPTLDSALAEVAASGKPFRCTNDDCVDAKAIRECRNPKADEVRAYRDEHSVSMKQAYEKVKLELNAKAEKAGIKFTGGFVRVAEFVTEDELLELSKAIRAEALEEAAKVCRTAQAKGLQSIREAIEAAIRGLK